jgi:hypothetical protein
MKIITYVDENTFEKTEQQFGDFHYELAENIKEYIHDRYDVGCKLANATEILSNKDGDKIIIGVIKNRLNDELISEKYRITIEKI